MLESLTLKNFQAHSSLKLKLDPHVTTVIGPTDSGKSAIIRALRWVCRNRPGGDEFLKHGEDKVSVTLRFDGGRKLRRTRAGTRTNTYLLDGSVFRAFGATIPDPVVDALKLDDINFQGQHDAPYWFGENDGAVARKLNAVVNLGIIDETLARCAQRLRSARSETEVTEKRIAQAREDIAKCADAEEFDARVVLLEQKHKAVTVWSERASDLSALLKLARDARMAHRRAKALVDAGEAVVSLGGELKAVGERAKALAEQLRTADRLRRLAKDKASADFAPVALAADRLRQVRERRESLSGEIDGLRVLYRERMAARKALYSAETELSENTPEACPLCGAPMKGHTHA